MFTLAHLSDVHLAPLPVPSPVELLSKRAIGLLSWHLRRRKVHKRSIADALAADITAAGPDHIALTGDLVNIATRGEFDQASRWLSAFAAPEKLSYVPGNHDAYVAVKHSLGHDRWAAHMSSDLPLPAAASPVADQRSAFPFVRLRGDVALIGLSSACPSPFNKASGRLGPAQLALLDEVLTTLKARALYRIILIHHPPLPGQAKPRKALDDAPELVKVLQRRGAELVLHGHNHIHMRTSLETSTGPAHILGAPSASAGISAHCPPAAWYHHTIERHDGHWQNQVRIRSLDTNANSFHDQTGFTLENR